MQINKFTDLGLRVLMYLGFEDTSNLITISEIAQQFDVHRNHLIKVVTKLNKLGWIEATRGRSGGLRLAKYPRNIRLGDVLSSLENQSLIDCGNPPCPIRGECNLKHLLDKGLNNFYKDMNQYTLKDVLNKKTSSAVIKLHQSY